MAAQSKSQLSPIFDAPEIVQALQGASALAVAVSGGPDSMALTALLAEWGAENKIQIHALTVDHGLRAEAAAEAQRVQEWLARYPEITHTILTWNDQKPSSAIQEEARKARYALMAEYCEARDIGCLLVAHHQDDQAETVLFRLAKGSGLKGLSGMRPAYQYNENLTILRPLLNIPKADLINFCEEKGIPFVQDPSNENDQFARIRLRQSAEILAEEGLTAKRLSTTAKRLARAEEALKVMANEAWNNALDSTDTGQVVLKLNILQAAQAEIALRLIIKSFNHLITDKDYLPRMEKLETLSEDLTQALQFPARTLGGLKFTRDDKANKIIISIENR